MLIKTHVLNLSGVAMLHATTAISAQAFFKIGESRLELASKQTQEWAAEIILHFGEQLVALTKSGTLGEQIDHAAVQVAVSAWVFDTLYENLEPDTFMYSDLELSIYLDGAIEYVFRPVLTH